MRSILRAQPGDAGHGNSNKDAGEEHAALFKAAFSPPIDKLDRPQQRWRTAGRGAVLFKQFAPEGAS